jgi:hypothetical protein
MVDLFFPSIVKIPLGVHQELYATTTQDAGADWRIIVAAAGANVILGIHQQFGHCLRAEIPWHYEVSDFVGRRSAISRGR